ncbi:hypothetical protein R4643_12265 [Acinetobacter baumannii]|nr:hypothetical protein [Acinetobacter baumannii]
MNNIDFTFFATIFLTIVSIIIAFAAFYYTRGSYLLTLKQFEKKKNRREKASEYFEKYINKPPSYKINTFTKKIDSDELTENIGIPSEFTDFFIKNFPDQFYYFLSLIKTNQEYFTLIKENNREELISRVRFLRLKMIIFLLFYFILGMLNFALILIYEKYISPLPLDLRLMTIVLLLTLAITTSCCAVFSIIHSQKYNNIIKILKKLNKLQVKQYNFSFKSFIKKYNPLRSKRKNKNTNVCQLCKKPAPFKDKNSSPYFEIYSIKKLSPSETDTVEKTISLCSNCYKKMHVVNAEADREKLLLKKRNLQSHS